MKYGVLFFTRSNTSRRIAETIAKGLGIEPVQITDHMNWDGLFGFIKAGFYSTVDKQVETEILGEVGKVDEYVLVAPLWAGGIAPAGRTFLKSVPREKVHLVVSSDGSLVKDRAGFKTVCDIVKSQRNEDEVVQMLVHSLKRK